MRDWQIDRWLGQTPCLCGAEDTWHVACFKGKTDKEVEEAYKRVYAKIRRRLRKGRVERLASAIEKAMSDSQELKREK